MVRPIHHWIFCVTMVLLGLTTPHSSSAGSAAWQLNPVSSEWQTAANWMPNTVPNGPFDTATFNSSNLTEVTLSDDIEVSGITFSADANQFASTLEVGATLSVTGTGMTNNSTVVQTFAQSVTEATTSLFLFFNNATAGERIVYNNPGGDLSFDDFSNAGKATFFISGFGSGVNSRQGNLDFDDSSTAAEAMITVTGFAITDFSDDANAGKAVFTTNDGGAVIFDVDSTAAQATFQCNGGAVSGRGGGGVDFGSSATAAEAHFTINGATVAGALPADTSFSSIATASNGVFVLNGGTASGAEGALMNFFEEATAANATVTANGGLSGGDGATIFFFHHSDGGTASFKLSGNGQMDIGNRAQPGVTIGSLEGDGLVFLGPKALVVGSNNRSTTFAGTIQDRGINQGTGGSITKIGTGTLTFSGANTYTGTTTVNEGVLKVGNKTGSATGPGAVTVSAGTIGGRGRMEGAATIGTGSGPGAFLAPSVGSNKPVKLTVESSLTFKADSIYIYKLDTRRAKADQVVADGITIQSGAQFSFNAVANKRLQRGQVFTAISNTSASPISGTFANLADGSILTAGRNKFEVSYSGGDGNDLTLAVTR